MEKNKCERKRGFDRASCVIKKELCDKRNHEIAKAGVRIYSVLNPTNTVVVPIVEVASLVARRFVCKKRKLT